MAGNYRSQQRRRILASYALLALLAVLLVLLVRGVWGVYAKQRDSRERLELARAEHDELAARSSFLEREIERLSTETGVEEEIRRQYGLAREGERVFIIVEQEAPATTTAERGFWGTLLGALLFWRE